MMRNDPKSNGSINNLPEAKEENINSPLIPKQQPFTIRQAAKNISKLSLPFTLSHLFNLGGPVVQGGYMGNGTQLQREAFGLIETFINSILTSSNASQIVIQMSVSSNDGLVQAIETKIKTGMLDFQDSFAELQQALASEEKTSDALKEKHKDLINSTKTNNHEIKVSINIDAILSLAIKRSQDSPKSEDHHAPTDPVDKLVVSLANLLSNTIESLTTILKKMETPPESIPTINELFQNLKTPANEEDSKDDNVRFARLVTTLTTHHEKIIKEGYAHVGLNMRAGMLYAQALLIPVIPLFLSLKSILVQAGVEPEVAQETANFFQIFALGSPAMVGMLTNREIFNALHHQWLALGLSGFNMLSNILLGGGLFYGWGKLPEQGTAGIATAFSTSAWLTFLGGSAIFLSHPTFRKFQFISNAGGNFKKKLGETFREGLKVLGMALPDYLLLTVVMVLVSRYSAKFNVSADVAQGAFSAYNLIWYAFFLGNTDATINLTGRAREEKASYKLLQYARASGLIHAGLGLLSAGLFWGIPKPLFNTFCLVKECPSEELDQFSDIAFYGAFAVIADALVIGSKGILAGLGDLTPSMIISIMSLVVVGISLQVGIGVPQDVSPAGLNLLRFLAIVPSLIGHLINLGYTTDKKINAITQQTQSPVADGNAFDTASGSTTEATSCLKKISEISADALKGWSLFCKTSTIEIEEVEVEEVEVEVKRGSLTVG